MVLLPEAVVVEIVWRDTDASDADAISSLGSYTCVRPNARFASSAGNGSVSLASS
jgi:hypothetical protein